jgi:hypothetical protein
MIVKLENLLPQDSYSGLHRLIPLPVLEVGNETIGIIVSLTICMQFALENVFLTCEFILIISHTNTTTNSGNKWMSSSLLVYG